MSSIVDKINSILSTYSGRDKVAKLLQYSGRVAMWYYTGRKAEKAAAFKTLMGDFRRVGYLLGSLSVLPGLEQNFAVTKPSNPKWLLETTANLCDFVYFICDNVSLLADYGILPLKRATNDFIYDEIGTKVWVASSVCWLLLDVMEVQHLLRIAKRDASQEKDLINLYKSLASNACNLLIGWYFLFPDKPVTSPMAGGLGMIAALISLHSMWVKK